MTVNEEPLPDPEPPSSGLPSRNGSQPSHWWWILALLGVDAFSSLSYQPSITYMATGLLGPIATAIVVLILLAVVLPIFRYLAAQSPTGQGSIALLEALLQGWIGKTLILILLGFAVTDFVMLKSLSVADAAEHLLGNDLIAQDDLLSRTMEHSREIVGRYLGAPAAEYFNEQLIVAMVLGVLGFVFWFLLKRGFNQRVLLVVVPLVALYLLLNGIVIARGMWYLLDHPERFADWWESIHQGSWQSRHTLSFGTDLLGVILLCVLLLPYLALGLSGFEMSLILMPQVRGARTDTPENPEGRVRNTRKLLTWAVVIMSVYLLSAVFVTTLLIPPEAFGPEGEATHRSLAYLAHGGALIGVEGSEGLGSFFGSAFGTFYDVVSILVLCLAGSSVMTALALLLPRFLLRFGMELKWANRWGLLFLCFAVLNFLVTLLFQGRVEHQRSAYATGVLGLLVNACLVATLHQWRRRPEGRWYRRLPWLPAGASMLFLLMFIAVVISSPSGLLISSFFIGAILTSSVLSRALRTDELRTIGFAFVDHESHMLWDTLRETYFPVLVPHRPGRHGRESKEATIRRDHQLSPEAEVVFLEVEVDDPSNFYQQLKIEVTHEGSNIIIRVTQCASISHAIAAVALAMAEHHDPPGIHFGWSEVDLLAASWSYLAFGEGNVPMKVRELLLSSGLPDHRQPRVVIG